MKATACALRPVCVTVSVHTCQTGIERWQVVGHSTLWLVKEWAVDDLHVCKQRDIVQAKGRRVAAAAMAVCWGHRFDSQLWQTHLKFVKEHILKFVKSLEASRVAWWTVTVLLLLFYTYVKTRWSKQTNEKLKRSYWLLCLFKLCCM